MPLNRWSIPMLSFLLLVVIPITRRVSRRLFGSMVWLCRRIFLVVCWVFVRLVLIRLLCGRLFAMRRMVIVLLLILVLWYRVRRSLLLFRMLLLLLIMVRCLRRRSVRMRLPPRLAERLDCCVFLRLERPLRRLLSVRLW